MDLLWIPLAVGVQLVLLYAFMGGPVALLGRFAGYEDLEVGTGWGGMQIGLPVALVLSFPSLMILALIEKWARQVGLFEVVLVQGIFLVLLLGWLKRRNGRRDGESLSDESVQEMAQQANALPEVVAAAPAPAPMSDVGVAIALAAERLAPPPAQPALEPVSRVSDPIVILPQPVTTMVASEPEASVSETEALLKKLRKIYMWDDVGLGRGYAEARKTPLAHLISNADMIALGDDYFSTLRTLARTSIANVCRGNGACQAEGFAAGFSAEMVLDRYEYEQDVMRRLAFSAVFSHDRLFIDQTDVELCSESLLLTMYRLVLFEVREGQAPDLLRGRLH